MMKIDAAAFHRIVSHASMPWRIAIGYLAPLQSEAKRAMYLSLTGVLLLANSIPIIPPSPATTDAPNTQVGATGGSALHLEPPTPLPARITRPDNPDHRKAASEPPQPLAGRGVPRSALLAYRGTEERMRREQPRCGVSVALLAAVGRVESNHARGGDVDRAGTTRHPILGPRLDGSSGFAAIRDTDGGRYDGDTVWDRAVGPMQFIPSTWARWGSDGNGDGDGDASPHNLHDAALAAGRYLCSGDRDLSQPGDLRAAILSYNHSERYLRIVLEWMSVYSGQAVAIPDAHDARPAGNPDDRSRRARTEGEQVEAAPAAKPQGREQDRQEPPGTVQPATPTKPSEPPTPDDETPIPGLNPAEPVPLPNLP